jgi:hypothetical protein
MLVALATPLSGGGFQRGLDMEAPLVLGGCGGLEEVPRNEGLFILLRKTRFSGVRLNLRHEGIRMKDVHPTTNLTSMSPR